jgi:hypothetical protein
MFTHPYIMADLARTRRDDLIAAADRDRQAARLRHHDDVEVRAPAPARSRRDWSSSDTNSAGRLRVCEGSREVTAGQAR